MGKLNIHVINKYFYPVTAGIEINILNTYGFMAKNGWNITVHTSKDTLTEKNVLTDSERIKDFKVKRYPSGIFGYMPKINYREAEIVVLCNFNIFPHFLILLNCLVKKIM